MPIILLTKNPSLTGFQYSSVQDNFAKLVDTATQFNIATGFITNDSIATLQKIVDYKKGELGLNLFIGMHYIEGFTKIQYNAVKDLDNYLTKEKLGNVYLSPNALYHGKMYSFLKNEQCLGSFIGSSNLGSFVGKDPNYIESDTLFSGNEGLFINDSISQIIKSLGVKLSELSPLTEFIEPESKLLQSYHYVDIVPSDTLNMLHEYMTGIQTYIPLKAEPKSNLNPFFGAGKISNKYSPRGWYEVELIIGKREPAMKIIPTEHPITVITNDGYKFECERQGDYSKNFRSRYDLKILGRWIKGQMENAGALEIGKPVTESVLLEFGKNKIVLKETAILDKNGNQIWYISLA